MSEHERDLRRSTLYEGCAIVLAAIGGLFVGGVGLVLLFAMGPA